MRLIGVIIHLPVVLSRYLVPGNLVTWSKLRKVIEKPSEDPTKLPKAQQEHDEAKEVFELMNDQLITELPQLLDLRVPYFDPSFEAMIRMQCKFAEEGYEKMSAVQR